MDFSYKTYKLLCAIKEKKPLIHHITNYVTVNDCANVVLAIGGSPVMADSIEEVEDVVSIASSLVVNIGTLNSLRLESILKAGRKANMTGIPVILDPVGIGAIPNRKAAALKLVNEIKFSVIRGNAAEINALCGMKASANGVASEDSQPDAGEKAAVFLAGKLNTVVAVTGATDYISDGTNVISIKNGHEMLAKITGTGCMTTSLIAAYCSVAQDYMDAAAAGVLTMGIAGEKAYEKLKDREGTGSFKRYLMDTIYNFSEADIVQKIKIFYGWGS